ncbi:Lrp/AsnC family transcriptional regulator [Vibrio ostreicida]|uniref:Lrp/AsnC family transcriptional regulator n=1 Tax=Vibrio ostreicida TaxID=526588 RepID=A0ABT8BYM1_9VIBR|nr:Lrp/AsnC family transcriptional regulator [Vibrio ostreicida]MDN3611773.1 Lrp/AsnC family transcriptional regulator [Vibrio ostreicida]NPD09588.1 Lrp/AsnC family transcriptional regulator [Vibrio ostreicida]
MSTTNLQELDKLDRRILSSLLSNGRESIANLSRSVGLSRTAVAERISRLEKTGIIKGYTAQLRANNEVAAAASYLLISCEKGKKNHVIEALKELPEVKLTSIVGGTYDIIALIEAPDLQSIHTLCNEIESFKGIHSLNNTVVLHHPIRR